MDYYNGMFTTQLVEGVTIQKGLHPDRLVLSPRERCSGLDDRRG